MSENEIVKFKGTVRWVIVPPNSARKPPTKYIDPDAPNDTTYSVEVECSKEKFKELIKMGIPPGTQLREDEEGGKTYIKVRASKVKRVKDKETGEMVDMVFTDPFVKDKGGNDVNEPIGDGSEAIVVTELAATKRGKVLRLKGLQVLNHIPYVPKETNPIDKYNLEKEESINDFTT